MPGSIKIDDGSGNYTILTNAGSLGSDKTITVPNETATLATTNGITMADQWRLTTSVTTSIDGITNWERPDGTLQSTYIGGGMSESSGIWTFPTTGIYWVTFRGQGNLASSGASIEIQIDTSNDNFSSHDTVANAHNDDSGATMETTMFTETFVDIQDTSNDKVRFNCQKSDTMSLVGDTNASWTQVCFIRLGDT